MLRRQTAGPEGQPHLMLPGLPVVEKPGCARLHRHANHIAHLRVLRANQNGSPYGTKSHPLLITPESDRNRTDAESPLPGGVPREPNQRPASFPFGDRFLVLGSHRADEPSPPDGTNMKSLRMAVTLRTLIALGLLAGAVFTPAIAGDKQAKQAKLEAKAKISKADAEKIALDRVQAGTVVETEIEKEWCKLVWSIELTTPGTQDITEVEVNAKTGKVISVEKETQAEHEKEKKKAK